MADFCSKCAPQMWGEDTQPDININEIFKALEDNSFMPVLCEGCGLRAIGNENGVLLLAVTDDGDEEPTEENISKVFWLSSEEFQNQKPKF
jgi:hypothetical protein